MDKICNFVADENGFVTHSISWVIAIHSDNDFVGCKYLFGTAFRVTCHTEI